MHQMHTDRLLSNIVNKTIALLRGKPMIKSMIFLSLYTAAGIGSWGAYSYISEEDASIKTLSNLVTEQIGPKIGIESTTDPKTSNIIYRWQDYKGNWTYEDKPYSELTFDNYEDELKFLQKLKENREQLAANPNKNSNIASDDLSPFEQIKKLFADAKNVQNLVNIRKEEIDKVAKNN